MYSKPITMYMLYELTYQFFILQSPPKESLHFCQAEYSKLTGARRKIGDAQKLKNLTPTP